MNEETKLCGSVGNVPGGTATCISPAGHPPLTGEGGAQWAHGDDGQMWGDVVPPVWGDEHRLAGFGRCGAVTSVFRCVYSADHPPLWLNGERRDHATGKEGGPLLTWNDVPAEPPAPRPTPCLSTYIDTTGKQHVCTMAAGHSGYMHHDAGTGTGWNHTTTPEQITTEEAVRRAGLDPQRVKVITGAEVLKLLTEGCGECDECKARVKPSAAPEPAEPQMSARVRFVALPDVPGLHTSQFALIVDCVGSPADADSQRQMWDDFGDEIGAATTLVYPGALYVDTSDVS